MKKFYFKRLRDVNIPTQAYDQAAGWDFYVPNHFSLLPKIQGFEPGPLWESTVIQPNTSILIPSGLQLRMHSGIALRFDNRSSKAIKGLLVGATIVDQDYQGEIHINLWNVSKEPIVIKCGEKILQGIFFETEKIQLNEIESNLRLFTETSNRSKSGFGSSDKKHQQLRTGGN